MIIDVECTYCNGEGRIAKHHAMDPFDDGEECWRCKGSGVLEENVENEIEDWME